MNLLQSNPTVPLISEYLTRAAQARSEAVAFSMSEESITYGELETRSNKLANLLIEEGCTVGDRIALLAQKSPATITALLAILKAGCTYVPLDTESPPARLDRILTSSEPMLVIADDRGLSVVKELNYLRDRLVIAMGSTPGSTNLIRNAADASYMTDKPPALKWVNPAPAALLFTSGSTGEPKGIPVSHHSIVAFVDWAVEHFQIKPEDRCSSHSPLIFDLSILDIFGSIAAMSHCVLVPPRLNLIPANLADFIRHQRLTQWFSVPAALVYMAQSGIVQEGDFPDLRRVIWCGEVLPPSVLKYLKKQLPGKSFTNLYGPTEATIASSYFDVPDTEVVADPLPIGYACDGEELLVLDEEMHTAEPGAIGHLYIGGVGLARGYWKDGEKTAASFVNYEDKNGETVRLFKTGDLASIGPANEAYYHGRNDYQIKSRGYRMELGEIESALAKIDSVIDAVVVAVEEEEFGSKAVCAAIVVSNRESDSSHIRQELRRYLPTYMLPRWWMILDSLPFLSNGKRDRRKLEQQFRDRYQNPTDRYAGESVPDDSVTATSKAK